MLNANFQVLRITRALLKTRHLYSPQTISRILRIPTETVCVILIVCLTNSCTSQNKAFVLNRTDVSKFLGKEALPNRSYLLNYNFGCQSTGSYFFRTICYFTITYYYYIM